VASGYQIAKVGINQVSNVYKLFDFDRKIYLEFKGKKRKKTRDDDDDQRVAAGIITT
jgi:hypothetical protein